MEIWICVIPLQSIISLQHFAVQNFIAVSLLQLRWEKKKIHRILTTMEISFVKWAPGGISIEFEIRPKFVVLWFKIYTIDHNEILHTSQQCNCHDVCKISLWSVEYILNFAWKIPAAAPTTISGSNFKLKISPQLLLTLPSPTPPLLPFPKYHSGWQSKHSYADLA